MTLPGHNVAVLRSQLTSVRSIPGLLAFCSLVGSRIDESRSLESYHMLVALGASPGVAHEIIEGWPTRKRRRLGSLVTGPLGIELSIAEEGALRLIHFVPAYETYDWPGLLARSARVAAEKMGPGLAG